MKETTGKPRPTVMGFTLHLPDGREMYVNARGRVVLGRDAYCGRRVVCSPNDLGAAVAYLQLFGCGNRSAVTVQVQGFFKDRVVFFDQLSINDPGTPWKSWRIPGAFLKKETANA